MRRYLLSIGLITLVSAAGIAATQLLFPKFNVVRELQERTSGELVRHLLMRLDGHTTLEAVFDPLLHRLQRHLEPALHTPLDAAQRAGKGQQLQSLPAQSFAPSAGPVPVDALMVHSKNYSLPELHTSGREWLVNASPSLSAAMAQAVAGDVITLVPGEYELGGGKTGQAGRTDAPIYLRAEQPNTVHIRLSGLFYVNQPHWIFENLNLLGNCPQSGGPCEHAFHVVGPADGTVIRNNHLQNFYAHIKVNGLDGRFPRQGLVQFNTLVNEKKIGYSALTPFDLVGASQWTFSDNLVHHFVKGWSPHASYGVFMKGGGSGGRIERNLIVCTGDGDISHQGSRVGISMGGGLTEARFCPDRKCIYEHADGIISNNVIANCNDFGIDNNTSIRTIAAHNTLINTYGIDARGTPSTLNAYGNHLSGQVIAKKGGEIDADGNDPDIDLAAVDPLDAMNAVLNSPSRKIIATHPMVGSDFCGHRRPPDSQAGALISTGECAKAIQRPKR